MTKNTKNRGSIAWTDVMITRMVAPAVAARHVYAVPVRATGARPRIPAWQAVGRQRAVPVRAPVIGLRAHPDPTQTPDCAMAVLQGMRARNAHSGSPSVGVPGHAGGKMIGKVWKMKRRNLSLPAPRGRYSGEYSVK